MFCRTFSAQLCQLLYFLISRHFKGAALIPEQARLPVAFQGAVTSLVSQPQGAALGWQVLPRWGVFPFSFVPAGTLPLWGGLGWGFPLPLWGGPGWGRGGPGWG